MDDKAVAKAIVDALNAKGADLGSAANIIVEDVLGSHDVGGFPPACRSAVYRLLRYAVNHLDGLDDVAEVEKSDTAVIVDKAKQAKTLVLSVLALLHALGVEG